jgi:hypothetical protein
MFSITKVYNLHRPSARISRQKFHNRNATTKTQTPAADRFLMAAASANVPSTQSRGRELPAPQVSLIAGEVFTMSESGGSNVELAQRLSGHNHSSHSLGHEILEIAEAVVLALVAIATAWSGYQAALWTGHQEELYGQAANSRLKPRALPHLLIRSVYITPRPP